MAKDKRLIRKRIQKDASAHVKGVKAKFLRDYLSR